MIETKKKPEKVFANNPPKKEVPKAVDVNTQDRGGWNNNFNSKYKNKDL